MDLFDIHTHIVPGVDDGAANIKSAEKLLKLSYDSGVKNIIVTPHYNLELGFTVSGNDVIDNFAKIAKKIASDLNVFPGNEIFYSNDIKKHLQDGRISTLANSRYVLVEFYLDIQIEEIIFAVNEFLLSGYWPIVAHVERYKCVYDKKSLYALANSGAYFQVNARSVISPKFKTEHLIKRLFKNGLVNFVASDCHDPDVRVPNLRKCAEILSKKYGNEEANKILYDNPLCIVKNKKI